ncbi:hypothetical protein HK096_008614 [Nowakowskiella sp. JEL0078]|nr:hypothetical protein HK096_008614 [Nowakowskiella sp. JEL0078]
MVREAKEAENSAGKKNAEFQIKVLKQTEKFNEIKLTCQDLESENRIKTVKIDELNKVLETLMKFPDASIGQIENFVNTDQWDHLLSEMINSNNLRISLLEQKNNELRIQKIRLANYEVGIETSISPQTDSSLFAYSPIANPNLRFQENLYISRNKKSPLWDSQITNRAIASFPNSNSGSNNQNSQSNQNFASPTTAKSATSPQYIYYHHHHHHHHHSRELVHPEKIIKQNSKKHSANENISSTPTGTKYPPEELQSINNNQSSKYDIPKSNFKEPRPGPGLTFNNIKILVDANLSLNKAEANRKNTQQASIDEKRKVRWKEGTQTKNAW